MSVSFIFSVLMWVLSVFLFCGYLSCALESYDKLCCTVLGNYCWSVSGLGETLPNSILFMAYMFTFSLMACMRIAVKMLYEAIALMHVIA